MHIQEDYSDCFHRYRLVPTFGQGTIRRFHENASAMKKLAARDFEDLLQVLYCSLCYALLQIHVHLKCSIPVFEELLPEPHNTVILDLLFVLCTWHAYAKLRLHTASTLNALKITTAALGRQLRLWVKKTCSRFNTRELPKEESARHRRKAVAANKSTGISDRGRSSGKHRGRGRKTKTRPGAKGQKSTSTNTVPLEVNYGKVGRLFNLCTYKLHALGHYVASIARFGTTDNYSTQVVCFFSFILLLVIFEYSSLL